MGGSSFGPVAAFLGGMASFLSPCVLPLVPGYVSYIAGTASLGQAGQSPRWPATLLATLFVLGFATVFVALGATASAAGQFLLQYRRQATIAGGLVIILFGLLMLGLFRGVTLFQRDMRWQPHFAGGQPLAAFGLGLAFGFGWTPCIGPILGAILTVAAFSSQSDGIALLAVYSAGLGLPFVLAAAFTHRMLKHQDLLRRLGRPLQFVGGVVLVAMGIAMASGHLADLAFWMLRAMPWLARVG